GAEADQVDLRGSGDLANLIDRREHACGVRVEAPAALLPAGIAPAEQEGLQIPADRVLDETASGSQVEEVVPAYRRRDDEHRSSVDGLRRRGVLQQLGLAVTTHHRSGRHREVSTDLVDTPIDRGGSSAALPHAGNGAAPRSPE